MWSCKYFQLKKIAAIRRSQLFWQHSSSFLNQFHFSFTLEIMHKLEFSALHEKPEFLGSTLYSYYGLVPWETSFLVRRLRPLSCLQTWWGHKTVDPPAECNLYKKDKLKNNRARSISPSSEEILARGRKQMPPRETFQVPQLEGVLESETSSH